jgi:hypothetical protein
LVFGFGLVADMNENIDEKINEAVEAVMPFESWERLKGESAAAFQAFCTFRDYGAERNIKRAVESVSDVSDTLALSRKYRCWRVWASKFRWAKRASDYDSYMECLKQAEKRKTIEEREAAYRKVTSKMLDTVDKRLDLMKPEELAINAISDWMKASIDTEREVLGLVKAGKGADGDGGAGGGKQFEINFNGEFEGL